MFFYMLQEGSTGLAYVCLGASGTKDAVHHIRFLFRGYGVLHTYYKALCRVWAGLKLVLTWSGARIRLTASDTPLM